MSNGARFAIVIACAATFGVLSSASNQLETPITFLLNAGWAWAGVMVLGGWIAGSPWWGISAGVISGLVASTGYYVADALFRREAFVSYGSELLLWVVVSVVLGPLLGLAGSFFHRRGVLGLLAGLVVPVGASIEMILLPRWPVDETFGSTMNLNLQVARVAVWVIATATVALLLHRQHRYHMSNRRPADERHGLAV